MKVKIKRLAENVVVPTYATDGSAGLDLTATSKSYDEQGNIVYGVGWAFQIPKGYVGLLFPRSSNAKKDLALTNSVGVLDSDFRGEVTFKFRPRYFRLESRIASFFKKLAYSICTDKDTVPSIDAVHINGNDYEVGDRIGQIVIVKHPEIEFIESDELTETERGTGGYGSSGL